MADDDKPGGVQSVSRALELLTIVADAGGPMGVGAIAEAAGIPLPTIHRLLRTLVDHGFMRQLPSRRYALGFRLVPLGLAAGAQTGVFAQDVLDGLAAETGETANLALLSGDKAEYVAQTPSRHAMRMFTEIGRRVDLYCTGVGKVLLAQLDDVRVKAIVDRNPMEPITPYTITSGEGLHAALESIRADGYGMDEQEQEVGVRCVAVPVGQGMALSVSGPAFRITDDVVAHAIPLLKTAAGRLEGEQ